MLLGKRGENQEYQRIVPLQDNALIFMTGKLQELNLICVYIS